jgi:hypothetical protein
VRQGGNAIDAAVAVGYALAVTNPCCGNIGGGGFATIHLADGRQVFLREKAPLASTETMFLDEKGEVIEGLSLKGYKSVAVPGTVLGLDRRIAAPRIARAEPREIALAPIIHGHRPCSLLNRSPAGCPVRDVTFFPWGLCDSEWELSLQPGTPPHEGTETAWPWPCPNGAHLQL